MLAFFTCHQVTYENPRNQWLAKDLTVHNSAVLKAKGCGFLCWVTISHIPLFLFTSIYPNITVSSAESCLFMTHLPHLPRVRAKYNILHLAILASSEKSHLNGSRNALLVFLKVHGIHNFISSRSHYKSVNFPCQLSILFSCPICMRYLGIF